MATPSENGKVRTVYADYLTCRGQRRVRFFALGADGFTLDELAALEQSISKARTYLAAKRERELKAHYQAQLALVSSAPS